MNNVSQQMHSYMEENLENYLSILQQMVSINSFTTNPDGVNSLANLTSELFAHLDFQAELIQSENPIYGKHLFLHKNGTSDHSIVMISHLDTVYSSQEEEQNQFHFRQEGNRIYGPGTVDIKGGTVLIYMMLDTMRRFSADTYNSINWLIGLDATEEVLSNDFGKLVLEKTDHKTLACLVFEGGTPIDNKFSLVVARKGKANFKVEVTGRSAHAGNRHAQGANAIVQLAHTIQEIASLTNYKEKLTFNVGKVRGGSVVNRVPHFAEAEVEMRAFSPLVFQSGVEKMLALAHNSQVTSEDGYTCTIKIQLLDPVEPWPRNPQTDQMYSIWQAVGEELGQTIVAEERGGLSDGNLLWKHYPTLDGLGPVGNNAHCSERSEDGNKDQEYAVRSSFIPKAILNILAIEKLVRRTDMKFEMHYVS